MGFGLKRLGNLQIDPIHTFFGVKDHNLIFHQTVILQQFKL